MKHLPFKPEAVLFDMDGLIFDTEALYRDAVIKAAEENGFNIPVSVYLETIGLPSASAKALLGMHLAGEVAIEDLWKQASDQFQTMVATELRLKSGVIEMLDWLEEIQLPWAIVTSSDHDTVLSHLLAVNLRDRFRHIIARGDYIAAKPHPEPYLKAASRLGVDPSHCVALEDSRNGVLSASRAGLMTIMVPDLVQPAQDIQSLCAYIAPDLHTVLAVLVDTFQRNERIGSANHTLGDLSS
ncbi:HAD family phosphatase [Rhizobium laguerreae]|uniref:HAD family hydrolase n=1 Tax=Rhizobium laguerreae TaxID=1076926 RepID=UPI001C9058E3|nr:HAD family phosphatase [Rhizobium laguerreae]MBY3462944.1 HAD family phosphatase [Rhizobium laguerreae]